MVSLRQKSIEIIKEHQHPNGAYIASPNFGTYHYSWLRDGTFIAYSMDVVGEHQSAEAFYRWVHQTLNKHEGKARAALQKHSEGHAVDPAELLHTRYTLEGEEGTEDWPNFQLDGYGTWLWGLATHIKFTGNDSLLEEFASSIALTLDYIRAFWDYPNYDCWEEFGSKTHPSTLACLFGGVQGISGYLQQDDLQDLAAKIKERIFDTFVHGARLNKFNNSPSVDANLLWASIPFGVFEPTDPVMVNTVKEIEDKLVRDGGGVHRYPTDTYFGGGLWILLSAWLGWYYTQVGDFTKAKQQREWIERQQTSAGELPEQVPNHLNDQSFYQPWVDKWGEIATPLLWSHAMYLVLDSNIEKGA